MNASRKPRKHYSPAEKVALLRRHLIEKIPVSDLCDEQQLNVNVFYQWQRQFFENGGAMSTLFGPKQARGGRISRREVSEVLQAGKRPADVGARRSGAGARIDMTPGLPSLTVER
ncbi:MAG TPA: transposase [Pirellulales bacterium]|jgi:transposase-like protein|nr:transposase [Pirellulales bacterium]